jgi:hypothetical protein
MAILKPIFERLSVPRVTGVRVALVVIAAGALQVSRSDSEQGILPPARAEMLRKSLEQPLPPPTRNLVDLGDRQVCGRQKIPSDVQLYCRGENVLFGVKHQTTLYKFQDRVMDQGDEICANEACTSVDDGRVKNAVRRRFQEYRQWREATATPK